MAGRSSTSIGVGIALTVLSLLTLTLFVFTTVFFGKYKDKDRQVQDLQRDATEVVVKVTSDLSVSTSAGPREIHLEEEVFFPEGVIGRMLGGSRSIALLSSVLDNPFEVGTIRRVRHDVTLEYGTPLDSIQLVRLRDSEVRAGDVNVLPPGHDGWVVGDEPVVAVDWGGAHVWGKPV